MAGREELDRGRSLRAKCKSLSKTTWNHHERRQNNSVENAFQRFALSFVSILRRKHYFRRNVFYYYTTNTLRRTQNLSPCGFNLRTRVLKSATTAQERLDMRSDCLAAKILPVGVRGTKNVWCWSSLIMIGTTVTLHNFSDPFQLPLQDLVVPNFLSLFVVHSDVKWASNINKQAVAFYQYPIP